MAPTNAKIVWGFGRLIPYLTAFIYRSRYINTEDKDSLVKIFNKLKDTLEDAIKRENNFIPHPPSYFKKAKETAKKYNPT